MWTSPSTISQMLDCIHACNVIPEGHRTHMQVLLLPTRTAISLLNIFLCNKGLSELAWDSLESISAHRHRSSSHSAIDCKLAKYSPWRELQNNKLVIPIRTVCYSIKHILGQ